MLDGPKLPEVRMSEVRRVRAEVHLAPLERGEVVIGGAADRHELLVGDH